MRQNEELACQPFSCHPPPDFPDLPSSPFSLLASLLFFLLSSYPFSLPCPVMMKPLSHHVWTFPHCQVLVMSLLVTFCIKSRIFSHFPTTRSTGNSLYFYALLFFLVCYHHLSFGHVHLKPLQSSTNPLVNKFSVSFLHLGLNHKHTSASMNPQSIVASSTPNCWIFSTINKSVLRAEA